MQDRAWTPRIGPMPARYFSYAGDFFAAGGFYDPSASDSVRFGPLESISEGICHGRGIGKDRSSDLDHRSRLRALHASCSQQYIGGATLDQLNADARRWAQRQLAKLTEKAKKAGIRTVGLMMEGEPARQIVRAARSKRADLIVVGTHGRTGLDKFFVGSVAQRVVVTAPCPVVTVRGR